MKRILSFLLLFLLLGNLSFSQDCDIAQTGMSVNPGSIAIGQTADFKFSVYNLGSDLNCTIPANTVRIRLSLPIGNDGRPAFYSFVSVVSPSGGTGPYFTFTYNAIQNLVTGINQNPIPNGLGEGNITVRVMGIGATPSAGASSALNLQQLGGVSNTPGNDATAASLVVTSVILPIKMENLNVTSKGCQNTINWATLQEENTKSFTVESGKDGVNFKTITTVAAAGNSATRKTYSYTDANPTEGTTYYRLIMTDADGKYTYSNTVSARTDCSIKTVSVYPNPLLEWQKQLTVTVAGYRGQVRGELLTATGQLVERYTLRNGTNTLTTGTLSLGSYVLRIVDMQSGEATSQKIMVIR